MTPRAPGWTEEQLDEFREELDYCLDVTNWSTVAKYAGVSRSAVGHWKRGTYEPMRENFDAIFRLAKALRKLGL